MNTLRHSTSLLGPYDHLTTADKICVSALVPLDVKNRLFIDLLPFRGACDKILTRCLYMFDGFFQLNPQLAALEPELRELVVNNMLNALIDHLLTIEATSLLVCPSSPPPDQPSLAQNPTLAGITHPSDASTSVTVKFD